MENKILIETAVTDPTTIRLAKESLVSDVLKPLLDLVYLFKKTNCYNTIPDKTECDADEVADYYDERINEIYKGLYSNIYINEVFLFRVKFVIDGIKAFIMRFESADGLPDPFLDMNPLLRYFCSPFKIIEQLDGDTSVFMASSLQLKFAPTDEDIENRAEYFARKKEQDEMMGLNRDEDDYLMNELARTLNAFFKSFILKTE